MQEEKERQITAMKERVARVRYERTITSREKSDSPARQFEELVPEAAGLSQDDRMTLAAQRIQQQLTQQAPPVRSTSFQICSERVL